MNVLHRLAIVLVIAVGISDWGLAQEKEPVDEVESPAQVWERLAGGPGDDNYSIDDAEYLAFFEDLCGDNPPERITKLRKYEEQDAGKAIRRFACETLESLLNERTPEATQVLLDWLEFRRRIGPGRNLLPVPDKELYPAVGILTKRGAEIVPQLLEHAVAGPRSDSYGYRARYLFQNVMPDEAERKKALADFADKHPDKKEALAIFTPSPKVVINGNAVISTGKYGDRYYSVGQWKRMTIDAKKKDAPPKVAPPPK